MARIRKIITAHFDSETLQENRLQAKLTIIENKIQLNLLDNFFKFS